MPEILPVQIDAKATPIVTVAMPIYNAGKHLRQAVMSIVKQTFTGWELFIIDDGSTDNAIESIVDIQDTRIHILCDGKNKGLAARLNEAIDLAHGQYLARMDQDDVSYPDRLLRQVTALQGNRRLDLVATRAITIDENNNITGIFPYRLSHNEICARPWSGFYFPHPTWMGRIEWFRKYRYAEPAPYFCEDQELLLRSYRTSCFATLNEILFAYRIRGKANREKLARTFRAVINIQVHYFLRSGQWHYLLLALLVFMGRIANNWLTLALCDASKNSTIIEPAVLLQWNSISNRLGDGAR